jgi:DNA (cytosine-5)-methyltransferase 1
MRRKSTNMQAIVEVKEEPEIIHCVDLFCGVGGLTHGLIKGGVRVLAGIDIDSQCRFAYEANNKSIFIEKDINQITGNALENIFGNSKFRLLAGCAPCQPFSSYSRKSNRVNEDTKWELISAFSRLVKETKPDFVTMENVPQLLDHQVFQDFLKDLKDYSISFSVIECVNYGVPQTRRRLVLIASRLGNIDLLPPSFFDYDDNATVQKAISHLPKINAGDSDLNDPLHSASSLSNLNLLRIQSSKPGGSWRDWDKSLLAQCHRKKSGQTYPSVYGRMTWNEPSPTITTQCFGYGNGRFGHPEQDRAISLREAAILQTFPEDYCFLAPNEKVRFATLGRLIGNAVPVRLGEVIAQSFIAHLKEMQSSKLHTNHQKRSDN